MPRLFTALWPARPVLTALARELDASADWPPEGWRATPLARWHVTLAFHGEAEPGVQARRLEARAAELPAPWLRLAGAVSFPQGVAAAGVLPAGEADAAALAELVVAAGGDPASYRAHLTVARTSRRRDAPPATGPLSGYAGPLVVPARGVPGAVRAEYGGAEVHRAAPGAAAPGRARRAGRAAPVAEPAARGVDSPPPGRRNRVNNAW